MRRWKLTCVLARTPRSLRMSPLGAPDVTARSSAMCRCLPTPCIVSCTRRGSSQGVAGHGRGAAGVAALQFHVSRLGQTCVAPFMRRGQAMWQHEAVAFAKRNRVRLARHRGGGAYEAEPHRESGRKMCRLRRWHGTGGRLRWPRTLALDSASGASSPHSRGRALVGVLRARPSPCSATLPRCARALPVGRSGRRPRARARGIPGAVARRARAHAGLPRLRRSGSGGRSSAGWPGRTVGKVIVWRWQSTRM